MLLQIADKEAAVVLAEQALADERPGPQVRPDGGPRPEDRRPLARGPRDSAPVIRLVESSLADPTPPSLKGIALAVASLDARYGPTSSGSPGIARLAETVRLAAVEAVGRIRPPGTPEFIDGPDRRGQEGGLDPGRRGRPPDPPRTSANGQQHPAPGHDRRQ